jgi:hypothetical protein
MALQATLNNVVIDIKPAAGDPKMIAEKAVRLMPSGRQKRDSYEENDKIWAMFDRDTHDLYDEAVRRCETNAISLARSNPCFELWLILHLSEFDKPDGH